MNKSTASKLIRLDQYFTKLLNKEMAIDEFQKAVFAAEQSLSQSTEANIANILKTLDYNLEMIQYLYNNEDWQSQIVASHEEYLASISKLEPFVDDALLGKYRILWTTEKDRYLLIRNENEVQDLSKYIIYNTVEDRVIWIEDPDDLIQLVFQMKKANVKEVTNI